jgi:two-component system, chemotaxis family, protein-glutamate methylesterase/glutaminase
MPANTGSAPPLPAAAAPAFPVIVMAASAGGIAALCHIFGAFPADLPAAVAVVQHRSPRGESMLATVLQRCSPLPVQDAVPGACLQPGHIVLAPANHHLVVQPDGSCTLSDAGRVRSLRPAADVLFASVAPVFTTRVIAVVLTGWDSDGTNSIQIVKHYGGLVIAQDAVSSEVFQMPRSSIATGAVDVVLALEQIAPALVAGSALHVMLFLENFIQALLIFNEL